MQNKNQNKTIQSMILNIVCEQDEDQHEKYIVVDQRFA